MTILKKISIKIKILIIPIKRFENYFNFLINSNPIIEDFNQKERLLDDEYYNLINEYNKLL